MFINHKLLLSHLLLVALMLIATGCTQVVPQFVEIVSAANNETIPEPASPTRGVINVPQIFMDTGKPELQIRERSMLQGSATAQVVYDKAAGIVAVEARYEGLPYRPTLCYDYNPSNEYNQWPFPCVENGDWQIWFVPEMMVNTSAWYYDPETKKLLGHHTELPTLAASDVIAIEYPIAHMVETPGFEPDTETLIAEVRFEYDYHQILDQNGSGGTLVAQVRANLCDPNSVISYWTNGGLPAEMAINFDEALANIEQGGIIMIAISYSPNPKPAYLRARDNIMIGWLGAGPAEANFLPVSLATETYHSTKAGATLDLPAASFDGIACD